MSSVAATPVRVEPARRRAARWAGVLVATVWLLAPLAPLLLWAVADSWRFPDVLPGSWGLGGWRQAVDQGVLPAAARSALVGLVVAGLATPAGAMAGRALALHPPRWHRAAEVVLLAPVAVPPFAVVLGLTDITLRLRIPAPAALVAVLVVAALPYTTFVMRSAYAGYDLGFEEEARSLGAGWRAVLIRVHLPLVAPALAAAAFLAFLVGWSDYIVTLVVGGGALVTLPMLVGALASASGNEPVVAATALAAVLPPLLLLAVTGFFARRRWTR